MQVPAIETFFALNSLTPYASVKFQRLRLLDWSRERVEEVMSRTGCRREEVSESNFIEYADHCCLSEVLVPYRGRTYRTKHAFR